MAFDISSCHSFGIHGNDFFFHVLGYRILIFLDDLGFKFAFAIPGNCDLHVTVRSMHGFRGMAISAVVCFFVAIIVFGVTKLLIEFFIKDTFQ